MTEKKYILGGLGSLFVATYLLLLVLEEYVLWGLFSEIPYFIMGLVILISGMLFIGLGIFLSTKENNPIIAWLVLIFTIIPIVLLVYVNIMRINNLLSNLLFGYLGYLDETLDPIAKIFSFKYAEIKTTVIKTTGYYNYWFVCLYCILGVYTISDRGNRDNSSLALVSGILILVGIDFYAFFYLMNFIAEATNGAFSIFKATVGLIDFYELTIPFISDLLGPLKMGTLLTGIGFLFIDPAVGKVYQTFLLLGALPLAITLFINATCTLKESS
ncbi:MAG: hypothetical protein ACTSO9_05515 [Candidatus Helarchaeota archaeon]